MSLLLDRAVLLNTGITGRPLSRREQSGQLLASNVLSSLLRHRGVEKKGKCDNLGEMIIGSTTSEVPYMEVGKFWILVLLVEWLCS